MMNPYVTHPYVSTIVTTILANCAISSMPTPTDKSGAFYTWLFRFLHGIMLAVKRIQASLPDSAAKKALEAGEAAAQEEPPKQP